MPKVWTPSNAMLQPWYHSGGQWQSDPMAPEVNWLPPDGAWCEARLFKTNGMSPTKRKVTWILSLTLTRGKAPVLVQCWISSMNLTQNGKFPMGTEMESGHHSSLILWTSSSSSSSLNEDMMFPSQNLSSMKLNGFLRKQPDGKFAGQPADSY